MIKPSKQYQSPHFLEKSIPVEFLVLHYTAQSLEGSLDIFLSEKSKVSAHLLIGQEGEVHELVKCWEKPCYKAFHAGRSHWMEEEKLWENFNSFSLGIELVNLNGNLFPYTKLQIQALFETIRHLQQIYPALNKPHRILGHEHIAGFRGKVDPGCLFDWNQLFKEAFPSQTSPLRPSIYSQKQGASILRTLKNPSSLEDSKAKKISLILENSFPFWFKQWQLRFIK